VVLLTLRHANEPRQVKVPPRGPLPEGKASIIEPMRLAASEKPSAA
jgi:hypothetical protein